MYVPLMKRLALLFSSAIVLVGGETRADLITLYRQGFTNDTGENQTAQTADVQAYGWVDFSGSTATLAVWSVHRGNGGEVQVNVNAPVPFGDGLPQGYWWSNNMRSRLAYQSLESQPIVRSKYSAIFLSMELWNAKGEVPTVTRFALRIGDSWYVTQDQYTPEDSTWEQWEYELKSDTKLLPLLFEPSKHLRVTDDPEVSYGSVEGDVTAVGYYIDVGESVVVVARRMDNFTVSAVPTE